jgi:hypothetical protein
LDDEAEKLRAIAGRALVDDALKHEAIGFNVLIVFIILNSN